MIRRQIVILSLMLVAVVGLVACGKLIPGGAPKAPPAQPEPVLPPRQVPVTLTLQATSTINPNASNRPSPVVVRVYQLRTEAAFNAASYQALYDDDQAALGKDLVEKFVMTLRPGDQTALTILPPKDAQFLGIVAFYREFDNAQWSVLIPTPKGDGTILVDKSSVSFSAR